MEYSPERSEMILYMIKKHLHDFRNTVRELIETIPSCIKEINTIADELDKFHRGATIASVTGSSFGIAGGITTIVGLALAPVTLGASLIVSAVGIGVAVAGGVTGAGASIADTVNNKKNSKRVQDMVDQINEKMKQLKEISDSINLEVENVQSKLNAKEVMDVRLLGRGVFTSVEIGRLVQLGNITTVASRGAQLATRGVQAAAAVSGVLAALFILVDAYFIFRGAKDLHNGSKTEEAKQIRECAEELQIIYQELEEVNILFNKKLGNFFNA